ncbi:MAG: hypothetical protein AMXMBFR23_05220 [Chloroflexota bacterium]
MKITRMTVLATLGGLALVLGACGGGEGDAGEAGAGAATSSAPARWDGQSVSTSGAEAPFSPQVVTSNFGVGQNRLSLALFKPDQTLVAEAEVSMRLYRLAADPETEPEVAEQVGEFTLTQRTLDLHPDHAARLLDDATRLVALTPGVVTAPAHAAHEGDLTTVFVANLEFDRAGFWGIEVDATVDGTTYPSIRRRIFVQEHTSEPAIGDPAPLSRQATLADVDDIAQISSATEPIPAMLEHTIAGAVALGRPAVVAFVTPAFCQTRFCGPVLEMVVVPAFERYGDRVTFIHVEPYDLTAARTQGQLVPVPAVTEWGLRVEPILFVLAADGTVYAKLEGITDLEELSAAIEAVLD